MAGPIHGNPICLCGLVNLYNFCCCGKLRVPLILKFLIGLQIQESLFKGLNSDENCYKLLFIALKFLDLFALEIIRTHNKELNATFSNYWTKLSKIS